LKIVLITGLSGSGKSVALAVMEDAGFYCVDNLPVPLVRSLLDVLQRSGNERIALAIDARTGSSVTELPALTEALRESGHDVRVIYLEAKDDTLIKRYSETRRRHPLAQEGMTLPECIAREREMVTGLSATGHHIDTSDLRPGTLRQWVKDFVAAERNDLTLLFESFGYKHGVPLDADFVFDVRCLPNPYYDPGLRPLTGLDQPVRDYLHSLPESGKMLDDISRFLRDWLPAFRRDNRSYLTVAIGCTGGQHRSVFFCEELSARFRNGENVLTRHRGLGQ
jgi:UPF0042 nucleotide-binding protein